MASSHDRPHGLWVIYPFWLALFFNLEFIFWSLGLLLALLALAYVFVFWVAHWVIVLLAAGAIVTYIFKWARIFLVRMIVDFDANNGEGRVTIERLFPHPTLPETVQFPLQQAAQGSPEVNTKGMFNTLVTLLKGLGWLRSISIGDLTLKGPAAPFGITMYNIRDPLGVKLRLAEEWTRIEKFRNREKAERERAEQIDRMTIAVSQGVVQGLAQSRPDLVQPTPPPGPVPPSPVPPPAPDPMHWEPIWSLPASAAAAVPKRIPAAFLTRAPVTFAGGQAGGAEQHRPFTPPPPPPSPPVAPASPLGEPELLEDELPVDAASAPLGSTELGTLDGGSPEAPPEVPDSASEPPASGRGG